MTPESEAPELQIKSPWKCLTLSASVPYCLHYYGTRSGHSHWLRSWHYKADHLIIIIYSIIIIIYMITIIYMMMIFSVIIITRRSSPSTVKCKRRVFLCQNFSPKFVLVFHTSLDSHFFSKVCFSFLAVT